MMDDFKKLLEAGTGETLITRLRFTDELEKLKSREVRFNYFFTENPYYGCPVSQKCLNTTHQSLPAIDIRAHIIAASSSSLFKGLS